MKSFKKLIVLILFLGLLVFIHNLWKIELFLHPINEASETKSSVVLYSTASCPYCAKARQFLEQANISYTEKNIERSLQAAEEHRLLGGVGVPLLKINHHIVHGFDRKQIRYALENP